MNEAELRLEAQRTTGVAVWLPRRPLTWQTHRAVERGERLTEIVAVATRRWLEANGAPDAWVQVSVQPPAAVPGSHDVPRNGREAYAFFSTIARTKGPWSAFTLYDLWEPRPLVARWGVQPTQTYVVTVLQSMITEEFFK